jgi:hypothetical protein
MARPEKRTAGRAAPPMRARPSVLLFVMLALVIGVLAILAGSAGSGREAQEQEDEADRDQPIVAPSRVAASGGEPRVVLDSAEVRRIGLTTVALDRAVAPEGRQLAGQVIPEPERRVTLRAPVSGRLRLVAGTRWPVLGQRLEADVPLGRVSDARPLTVPMAGTVTAIGARPGEIVDAGQVLLELADNTRPVVRIAWPAEAGRPRERVTLLAATGARPVEASLIGPAPEADPQGDSVVVTGVQELLSEEFRARVTVGEESGE